VELDSQLSGCLAGTTTPMSPSERIEMASLCILKHLNRAAVCFYAEAFAGEPKLADDLGAGHRYNAACAAALAAAGQGKDADKLNSQQRAQLRKQAFAWLHADLAQWSKQAAHGSDGFRSAMRSQLLHWQGDSDLASVRGEPRLAKLPADERPGWRQLWAD